MRQEIEERQTFSYKYSRFWCLRRFDHVICCCLRPKKKRDDFLFHNAASKLKEEMDLLEILKKLRVYQFTAVTSLKPYQRDLINFFQDYKILDPNQVDEMPVMHYASESLDHLEDVEEALDARDQAVNHLYRSIGKLHPDQSTIDYQIIKRVTTAQKQRYLVRGNSQNRRNDTRYSSLDVPQDMRILKRIRSSQLQDEQPSRSLSY